ncbi:MAG: GIY-YIG nuclease family protein [Chitinophagales bacterium]|nr:GIY-YIG nuclease family protein [Chitinophagales bacterium]
MKSKKELKETYKEMKFRIGVFQIRNTVNNKIYIESSTDLAAIWNRNRFQLNNGLHPNAMLQKEWNEFGQDSFNYEILSEIKQDDNKTVDFHRKEAKQLETMFIEDLQPFGDKGYNPERQK